MIGRRRAASPAGDVHTAALRLLGRRAFSERELGERLQRKGFPPGEVVAEVERLRAAGLLDEHEVARAVTRGHTRAGFGRRAVQAVLKRRRVEPGAASAALEELSESEQAQALDAALARAARRYPDFERVPEMRAKVIRYLLSRGFSLGEACRAAAADPADFSDTDDLDAPEPPHEL